MNTYIGIYIMVIAGVFGFVMGMVLMLYAFRLVPKIRRKKNQRTYHKENQAYTVARSVRTDCGADEKENGEPANIPVPEPEEESEESKTATDEGGGLLKRRLFSKEDSWTEFNCVCDGVDTGECIRGKQKSEDASYQYMKKKKQDDSTY